MKKVVVLGIGNLVQSDDGFGVHVVKMLEKDRERIPPNVCLVDGGTSIIDQLPELSDATHLVCIDVADGGMPPGTIYRFTPEDVAYKKSRFHHAHKISIFDVLEMLRLLRGRSPDTLIIAVQPEVIDWGMGLSQTIEKRIEKVVDMVRSEIETICNE